MRAGKYARIERERRFLVDRLPSNLDHSGPHRLLIDHYLPNSRRRLRRAEHIPSGELVFKLAQKYSLSSTAAVITNIYLSEHEYGLLAALGGAQLTKIRYRYYDQGYVFAIDILTGRHAGLILAEIEFATEAEMAAFPLPSFAAKEVTADPYFTGARLAGLPKT